MWWSRLLKIKQGQIQHFKIFLEKNFLKLGWKKFLYLMEKPIYLMKINFLTCPKNFLRLVWKTNLLKQKKIIHFFKERTNLMICKCFPTFLKKFFLYSTNLCFFYFLRDFHIICIHIPAVLFTCFPQKDFDTFHKLFL